MLESLENGLGLSIVEFFQKGSWGDILWYLLYPFNLIGSEIGFLVLLPVVYWSVNKPAGKRLLILSLAGSVIFSGLKSWWKRPRPFHVDPAIRHIANTAEYGLPSGHTIFGTSVGLWVASYFRKWKITVIMIVCIFLMGISRMVHGMHYPQDVVTGWLLGGLFFGLYYWLSPKIEEWFKENTFRKGIIFSLTLLIVAFVLVIILSDQYEVRKSVLSPLGALVGGLLGIFFEEKQIRFSTKIAFKFRVIRGLVGLIVLITIYLLLDVGYYALFKNNFSIMSMIVYTFRYLLVGCTVTFIVPLTFKPLKI
jgi:undecaprenyl-diphosphatase